MAILVHLNKQSDEVHIVNEQFATRLWLELQSAKGKVQEGSNVRFCENLSTDAECVPHLVLRVQLPLVPHDHLAFASDKGFLFSEMKSSKSLSLSGPDTFWLAK